jgi:hypothetical protein
MKTREFPILDIQTHEKALAAASPNYGERDRAILTNWHLAAIKALRLGLRSGCGAPAAEIDGEIVPVEDWITLDLGKDTINPKPIFKRKAA